MQLPGKDEISETTSRGFNVHFSNIHIPYTADGIRSLSNHVFKQYTLSKTFKLSNLKSFVLLIKVSLFLGTPVSDR